MNNKTRKYNTHAEFRECNVLAREVDEAINELKWSQSQHNKTQLWEKTLIHFEKKHKQQQQ